MRRILSMLLAVCYLFTAQSVVHGFAMHWLWTSHDDEVHPCWHNDDHNKHSDHDDHDMSFCLEQSMGAFVSDGLHIQSSPLPHLYLFGVNDVCCFPSMEYARVWDLLTINDPWWNIHGSFSDFLQEHYWHSVILHC